MGCLLYTSELKGSLETIRSTAASLIDTIDGHFAEIQKAQDKEQTTCLLYTSRLLCVMVLQSSRKKRTPLCRLRMAGRSLVPVKGTMGRAETNYEQKKYYYDISIGNMYLAALGRTTVLRFSER